MITRKALRAIALATTCLAPLAAYAADDFDVAPAAEPAAATASQAPLTIGGMPFTGEIQIGVGGVMGSHPDQAGRYNGLNTGGVDVSLGEFNVNGRSPWDSGGMRYYTLTGSNLIFQTSDRYGVGITNSNSFGAHTNNALANDGEIGFRAGDQGTWGFGAYYDAITYTGNVIDSIYTVSGGLAFLNHGLTLYGGATKGAAGPITTYTIPQLAATGGIQAFQTGTRRDILGADFKYMWNEWTFTGALRHEHKEGSMEEAFDGPYGGTAFAMPIDFDTDRYDATAAYNIPHFQGMVQYTFSHFTDNNLFVNLPYPTSTAAGASGTIYQRAGAYSTPPSNDAHYLTIQLATDVIPKTRLNVNARFGLEVQNDSFAPNTSDPTIPSNAAGLSSLYGSANGPVGTSTGSPAMMAEVYQIKLSAASHPFANIDTRVYYGVDGRGVSLNQYKVFTSGTGGSSDSSLTGSAIVVPQDWLKQNAGAEVGFRIVPETDTKLTVGYRLDDIERSNAQVGHSSTSTGTISLLSQITEQVDGKISLSYADRSGAITYLGPWQYLGQTAAYSGAYYQAPMTSEAITARVDYTPMNSLSGSMFVQFKNENYNYASPTLANSGTATGFPLDGTGQGIKRDYALTFGPDVNYRPTNSLDIHLFYNYEMLFYNNLGNGACSTSNTTTCLGSVGYFQNKQTSTTNTVGISGDWHVNEKLRLRADYTLSYGSVMFAEFNGVFVATPTASYQNVSNYPDINSLMNSVKLTATYALRQDIDLILQGIYTGFHNNDWNDSANAIQGNGAAANTPSILTPGYASPNYSVVALMAGVKLRF